METTCPSPGCPWGPHGKHQKGWMGSCRLPEPGFRGRPSPGFTPGRSRPSTELHLQGKEARGEWMQENGAQHLCLPLQPSCSTLWEAPGQQVSSLISKKCSYLSALGSPNYTLPASSEGCGAAFNSDRREQTELCRTGGNKLICSRQHLPVAMLSSH